MFCPKCGKKNLDNAIFCESCGVDIDAVAPVVPSNVFSAWKIVLSKYFNDKGRASRTEFWYWQIFLFIVYAIVFFILFQLKKERCLSISPSIIVLSIIGLTIVPTINLLVRRVHDFNAAGWLLGLIFITAPLGVPQLGLIPIIVFGLIPGTKGPNEYGPRPIKR